NFGAPAAATVVSGGVTTTVPASEYSNGFSVVVPGTGRHEMLFTASGASQLNASSPITTKDWWRTNCFSINYPPPAPHQRFNFTSPDGVTYRFSQYSIRPYPSYQRPADTTTSGTVAVVQREQLWMLPTTVTDRFGNTVSYQYITVGNQLMPSVISSSDGRQI